MKGQWKCPLCGYLFESVLIFGTSKLGMSINGNVAQHLQNVHKISDIFAWVRNYITVIFEQGEYIENDNSVNTST